ncbi:MAG: hypothetical protein AAFV71_26350 [Cyanobacteria bacterium J06633_8]
MQKTLLYRLFKIGKLPKEALILIRSEGVLLQDEGCGGSMTWINFTAPGKYYKWKRIWFSGSIILTKKQFLLFNSSQPIIRVPWNDERISKLDCFLKGDFTLDIKFDASTFYDGCSGEIEVMFSTPLARSFLEIIEKNTASH